MVLATLRELVTLGPRAVVGRRILAVLAVLGCCGIQAQEVLISELMARNVSTIQDEDGEYSDWVEIHNSGSTSADLEGWYLSDVTENLKKWRFPTVSIDPGGFLLVFASGKDRRAPEGELHTDFRLSGSGEYLGLIDSAGQPSHEFRPGFPALEDDQSYGLKMGEGEPVDPQAHGILGAVSPGQTNGDGSVALSVSPRFSVSSHLFAEPFDLVLSKSIPEGVIRYSLGGKVPTDTSPIYSTPIRIESSVEVRAHIFVQGLDPGPVASEFYSKLGEDAVDFSSDLPVIVVETFLRRSINEGRATTAGFYLFEPGADGRTLLTAPPTVATRSGIKVRGSSSTGRPKKSYAVEFWEEGDNVDQDHALLGMPADSDWILYGPYNFDRAMIRNSFVYEISNQMGRYAVRTRFVEVFLNDDGEDLVLEDFAGTRSDYNGVYVLMEKIKRGGDRVDVESMPLSAVDEPEIAGGYILKVDRLDPGDQGFTGGRQQLLYVEPKESEVNPAQARWIKTYMNRFDTALSRGDLLDRENGYRKYYDVPSWIDHHIINEFTKNPDGFRLSGYMFKTRYGKLQGGPVWDFDRTLGPDDDDRAVNPTGWSQWRLFSWFRLIFNDPDWRQEYTDRWHELRGEVFQTENLMSIIDELSTQIEESQRRNYTRWTGLSNPDRGWPREVLQLKSWVDRRVRWMDTQFAVAPEFDHPGGAVEDEVMVAITPAQGTIYYRLDGLDPRLSGGAIRPDTQELGIPEQRIPVSGTTQIVARSLEGEEWSPLVERIFVGTEPSTLSITEVMYNPPADPSGDYGAGQFEFIELQNTGSLPVNAVGVQFTVGIDFTFPNRVINPGEVVVVVKNDEAFKQRYDLADEVVIGTFGGSLNNSGDQVTLVDPVQRILSDFEYDDQSPWPNEADGEGSSLVLLNARAPSLAASWSASEMALGDPGIHKLTPDSRIEFLSIVHESEGVRIQVRAESGGSLIVLSRSNVDSGDWLETGVQVNPIGDGIWEFTDEIQGDTRWYRVVER